MLLLMEETLGRRIKRLRDAKRLGQKELGRIVGRSESWVSNVESGKIAELKAPQARLMASALGVSLDELLGQKQDPETQTLPANHYIRDLGAHIYEIRISTDTSAAELSRRVGKDPNYIGDIEGHTRWARELPPDRELAAIAAGLGMTLEQFAMTRTLMEQTPGEEVEDRRRSDEWFNERVNYERIGRQIVDLLKREAPSFVIPSERIEIIPDPPAEPMIEVPVYDRFAASYLSSSGSQAGDCLSVPARLWKRAQEPRLIYVSGPCLALRGILNGDYLVVDAANRDPQDGDIVAFRFRGDEAVKVCHRFKDRIEFRPTIETFPTITVHLGEEEDLEIVGVSVGLVQCAERG